ncbi:M48 family metallopeptidase [Phaeodactylibacter xiamenensis]|uniref:M48 family metallopeptidase n=1 Tax=Phaeodactylibacter xiamenensis TaxID=1524460 RepID=UPI0024A848F9|nr:SprT family zinc-dependent metalloprotease [Phaeodactylibacter xiamenensis]
MMKVSGIDIAVTKSRRKTVSIFIERDGTVSARVPEQWATDKIKQAILSKQYLIHKHLAEWEQLNESRVMREYVSGQSFLYLGRNYALKLVEEPLDHLLLKNGRFLLGKAYQDNAKELFVTFYKDKLRKKLPPLITRYQSQLNVKPNEVRVMELQNRWGSCSEQGNVNFHWKCAMAPYDVLTYIVVHELAHLLHPNHSPAFWNEVDKVLPRYDKQVEWLKRNGAGMDL